MRREPVACRGPLPWDIAQFVTGAACVALANGTGSDRPDDIIHLFRQGECLFVGIREGKRIVAGVCFRYAEGMAWVGNLYIEPDSPNINGARALALAREVRKWAESMSEHSQIRAVISMQHPRKAALIRMHRSVLGLEIESVVMAGKRKVPNGQHRQDIQRPHRELVLPARRLDKQSS